MQNDGGRQGKLAREVMGNLRGCDRGALFGGEGGEGLRKLGVAVVLACVGCREELFRGGEFGFELGTIAAVCSPGKKDC